MTLPLTSPGTKTCWSNFVMVALWIWFIELLIPWASDLWTDLSQFACLFFPFLEGRGGGSLCYLEGSERILIACKTLPPIFIHMNKVSNTHKSHMLAIWIQQPSCNWLRDTDITEHVSELEFVDVLSRWVKPKPQKASPFTGN